MAVVLVDVPSLNMVQSVPLMEYSMTKSVMGRPPSFPSDHESETVVSVLLVIVALDGADGCVAGTTKKSKMLICVGFVRLVVVPSPS